ncbi:MAG TPA: 1-(5-phosphoribosyl)-5-[(5-phosphoribosylamino)methylideneamino]imidazole-4-carboxamide isomerase [Alphaproteobacteria bacterium]|nr:1-(5-phosphoribosyl)-5-[(5-phosphoribosylamino)methylideneamino]imidazole-4-carboxamide isomerase [Alphaproteobacteria bacterium]
MILYPAIDLRNGHCVRLERGEMSRATVFSRDPAAQARAFAAAGFSHLHVVDLDGAFAGRSVNGAAIEAILEAVSLPVQLGGGVRDLAAVESWLGKGVVRIVLGTAAAREPAFVKDACRRFPGRIAIGIDARDGRVAVEGWAEMSELEAIELAKRYDDAGAAAVVFTDIARDGVLAGVNVGAVAQLARAITTPVIASGGVASLDDLKRLKALEPLGVVGVIVGRALYDGRLEPKAALAALAA